jgi:Na+/melibiose symporter-like transporter
MTGIKLMMGPISALFAFSGLYFFYRYSLTKEKYEEVLAKIESRAVGESSSSISPVQAME